jgi:hypothetical protein
MPSVLDVPVRVDHDAHDLHDEQPQVCVARSRLWQRLVQYVRRHRVRTPSRTQSSARSARRQMESPMACVAPEPQTLYLLGFWGLHNG